MNENITKKILDTFHIKQESYPEKSLDEIVDLVSNECNVDKMTVFETISENPFGECLVTCCIEQMLIIYFFLNLSTLI